MISTKRELPVLSFAPFRRYPTRQEQQQYEDSREVCQNCVSGGCCSSEDPVYLTSFDVFRFAGFFDMSPATFMLNFTQERFNDLEGDALRRQLIDDPDCSIVTYLRRRANSATSPCIFLKYIRDPDGLTRRICSVHEGRPLACREFYAHHCQLRVTGELATLQAEGFEKLRDGEITEELIDAELARFGKHDPQRATLSRNMQFFFWVEMKRAVNMDQANVEGAKSYQASDYQDPIDEKLNRILSTKNLRFEEKYGLKPRDEQLLPFTAGLRFAWSTDYERIMLILHTAPSSGLYAIGNYPFYAGCRMAFRLAKCPSKFAVIPDAEVNHFLDNLPNVLLFPQHDRSEVRTVTLRAVYAAILKAYNHLIRFASYVASTKDVLEGYEQGFLECELLLMIAGFEPSLNPFIARNPYFRPVTLYMAEVVVTCIEEKIASAKSPEDLLDTFRFLSRVSEAVSLLSRDLCARFEAALTSVSAKLEREQLDLYIACGNPIAKRCEAGKGLRANRDWTTWFNQVLDVRYATIAGASEVDLPAFYRQAVNELVRIPLRESYALDLYDITYNLACSMSLHDSIPYEAFEFKDAANDLATYAVGLFNWLQASGCGIDDYEIRAGFPSPIYRGLGLSYNQDASFGLIVSQLLESQLSDGSWQTDPVMTSGPDTQAEYVCTLYRITWACVDGLRPLKNDILNKENATLGLV